MKREKQRMANSKQIASGPWTTVQCAVCGEKTIYWKQWLTMEGWGQDRVTRRWICPLCLRREQAQR